MILQTTFGANSLFDALLPAEVMTGHYALCVGLLTFLAPGLAWQAITTNLTPSTGQTCSLFCMSGDGPRLDLHEYGCLDMDMGGTRVMGEGRK